MLALKVMNKIEENKEDIEKVTTDNLVYVEARIDKLDVLAFETKTLLNIENDVGDETELTSIATEEVEGETNQDSDDSDPEATKKRRDLMAVDFGLDFVHEKVENPLSKVKKAKLGKSLGARVQEKL